LCIESVLIRIVVAVLMGASQSMKMKKVEMFVGDNLHAQWYDMFHSYILQCVHLKK